MHVRFFIFIFLTVFIFCGCSEEKISTVRSDSLSEARGSIKEQSAASAVPKVETSSWQNFGPGGGGWYRFIEFSTWLTFTRSLDVLQ